MSRTVETSSAATSPRILFSFATKFYWTRNSTIGMFNTDQESLVMIPTISEPLNVKNRSSKHEERLKSRW